MEGPASTEDPGAGSGPSPLRTLLEVQDLDTAADRLRHRRRTLPELAELRRFESDLAAVAAEEAEVAAARSQSAARQRRAEHELASVEGRMAEINGRLYSGAVTVPRELQAMQGEIEALSQRRRGVEDQVLEAMAEVEPLDQRLELLSEQAESLRSRLAAKAEEVTRAESVIDAEASEVLARRGAAAVLLPADLSSLYEGLRRRLDGVGAARLVGGRCGGCHLSLSASERDRIRHAPPEALLRCEHCNRILVRADE